MSTLKHPLRFVAVWFALAVFTGCESSGGGSSSSSVGVYYGVGFYSPYYYGDYDDDIDIDIDRPDRPDRPVRPEHPIAKPPAASPRASTASERSAARPTPSIPSTPRAAPSMRGGGGRR